MVNAEDIFDYEKYTLPNIESIIDDPYLLKSMIHESFLLEAKEKFNESIENLKKDKIIKSALELEIYTDSNDILGLQKVEAEDLFLVSSIAYEPKDNEILVSFVVGDAKFEVYKAIQSKCPRCWKYCSSSEDELCPRCNKVVKA
jgi:isoleucyl-tRNA synthetase